MSARILLVDNYDSFTYNLVQAFRVLGAEVLVRRNDEIDVAGAHRLAPTHLVVSPGPGTPDRAGISMAMIEAMLGKVPILGVCLGHQALARVLGGRVGRAPRPTHGKASRVFHDNRTVYVGMPNPFPAGRYHSLRVEEQGLGPGTEISSYGAEGDIFGIRHRIFAAEGVQFHPESVLTPNGDRLLKNFLDLEEEQRGGPK
ncbi:MAG: aminodeoxychorismate/anthranilate synthase component II [Planctomycetota bacterium]